MNEEIKFSIIKKSVLNLLLIGGIIGLLFLSFFSGQPKLFERVSALTITPSVTISSAYPPTDLTATAISDSRINLNWTAPTSGTIDYYKVYRGGFSVGSSTITSYSDTGLSALTTYTYNVSTVNLAGVEGPQSSPAEATTLAASTETEEEEGGGPSLPPAPPEINLDSLIINNGAKYTDSLDVVLKLSAKNAFQVAVSNSLDFSGIAWERYEETREWTLEQGEGEKIVYVKFRSEKGGVSKVISRSVTFDVTPPINISSFRAIPGDRQAILIWNNPPDKDFERVKIVGSTIFYPSSPLGGVPLYIGSGTSFTAVGLTNGVKYYYTAFSYDQAGNYSSGALVSVTPRRTTSPEEVPPEEVPPEEVPPEEVPPEEVPPEIEKLSFNDFDFWRGDNKIILEEGKEIEVEPGDILRISIDYDKLPEVLKSIMVTLRKKEESFSFLLMVNSEKTKYEAVFSAPEELGLYNLDLTIFDYGNKVFKKLSGFLKVIESEVISPTPVSSFRWYKNIRNWLYILFLIVIVIISSYFVRRLRKRKEKKKIGHKKEKLDNFFKKDIID